MRDLVEFVFLSFVSFYMNFFKTGQRDSNERLEKVERQRIIYGGKTE